MISPMALANDSPGSSSTSAGPSAPAPNSNAKNAPVEPASFAQLAARVIIALALSMLLFAAWEARLGAVLQWTAREWRVIPSLSIYMVTAVMALCIQSAMPKTRWLLTAGLLAFAASVLLLTLRADAPSVGANPVEFRDKSSSRESEKTDAVGPVRSVLAAPATTFNFLGYEAALFSALLLGTWLGRGLQRPGQFLMFLLCAVSGNAWLAASAITRVSNTGTLALLRIPWPVGFPASFCPTLLELLVLCAILEGARNLRLHLFSIFLGSSAGYCGGAFLALEPWPGWPVPGVMMGATGMLIASWPDLRITRRDVLRSMLAAMVLLALLLGLSVARRHLVPEPEPSPDVFRYRGST